jgi:hypothetical protein
MVLLDLRPRHIGRLAFRKTTLKEVPMRLVKRFAVAISSLLALVLAGGAHWRL